MFTKEEQSNSNVVFFASRKQMSEAFITSAILALSGGFQDAYTYINRGEVFANAQTGNIVLMAGNFFEGKYSFGLRYLIPLLAFVIGIYVAEYIHKNHQNMRILHWRQAVVLLEMIVLFAVAFIPQDYNQIANALVSFSCAMQVQSFRKINGYAYASTMCIGNLRSGTESLYAFVHSRKRKDFMKTMHYIGIICFFAIGAGFGRICTNHYFEKAIWVSCILLFICFSIMFIAPTKEDK